MSDDVAFVSGPEYLDHWPGVGHPESPQRLAAIWSELHDRGLWDRLNHIEFAPATVDDIRTVHTGEYIALVRREVEAGRTILSTGDTNVCAKSYDLALLAAGGCMAAVKAVCGGESRAAFCAVRPPGHHATPSAGMGFCVFNNVAIAARYAQQSCGVQRVLIADWDVHHGNGTQDAFYDDGSVFYFSTHLAGHYPGTGHADQRGAGAGEGTTLNCPLGHWAGDEGVVGAFRELLVPAMADFAPELVIISAGFDCRRDDPLGGLGVSDDGLIELTRIVMEIASQSAGGKIVSVLEGGYAFAGLAAGAAAHIETLMKG